MKIFKNVSFYIILVIVVLLIAGMFLGQNKSEVIEYSRFLEELDKGNVSEVFIDNYKATVTTNQAILGDGTEFQLNYGDFEALQESLENAKVGNPTLVFDFEPEEEVSLLWSFLPYLLIGGVLIFVWMMIMKQSQGGGAGRAMNFGKSKAKLMDETDKKKFFKDVAGADEEKEELEEIVNFLKEPDKFLKYGARIPKGVLLVGPPGTGKTLLAKAVAGEAKVPFFSISGSDFVEMYVGVGASRVRDLFEQAKKNAPCLVFIDEIDAVGRHRGAGMGGGHDEREQTLNQLLVEMDGFSDNQGIIIIAATNRADILDPALLRPGRFDRRVMVSYPDVQGRADILKIHSEGKPLGEDVNLTAIAKLTPMFTGADLENLMNEAAILAARRDKESISNLEIKEAIFKVTMGPEKKSKKVSEKERKLTAYHEAGHAIASRVTSSTGIVDRVSIIPIGQAGGYTSFRPNEDQSFYTKGQLLEMIVISLGGRAAEEIALGEISTGASNDLQKANQVARNMIVKYGMSETLENMVFDSGSDEVFLGRDYGHVKNYSDGLASKIDTEVQKIIDESYDKVKTILSDRMDLLIKLAETLLSKEKIEEEEFEEIFNSTTIEK